ncbi:hypothetical protein GCM10011506_03110 [Marivirga lumbricoides]|uniref:histidine kinase n=1 Tax=Marivirga lumbricoides TaxID=1046115 RepID=A0ABQ1LBZ4_9BACT|nr:hypothetical protein GCM10011506_03110 [Marivirga lumbricoides]
MNAEYYNYEKFFELTPDLLCIAGFDGYFKKVNAAVSSTLGYSPEELYAKPINAFVHPDDVEMTTLVRASLTSSETLFNFENRYVTKSGDIIWLSWTSQPSTEDELVFAIAKNITIKKSLEIIKDNELANLVKLNNAYKQLSYTTSHDLRSPLDSLLSVFRLIDLNTIENERTVELINLLKCGGEKLKLKIDNYIDELNTSESPSIEIENIVIEEVLKKVMNALQTLIQNTQISIKIDFSEFRTISFNREYLSSIFLNLISNSIKFRRQSINPYLSIYSRMVDKKKQLVFEDNGLGFNMEEAKGKIFELNQTFHSNTDSKGIGLYLVKKHMQSMNGTVEVESEENVGTKFILTLSS